MNNDLQVVEPMPLPALTSKELLARVERIHEVQQKVMKRDVDYGVIPGCAKPSLYKSGAEILLQTFEMAALPEQADVQDLGNADEIRYRVVVPIIHIPTGRVVGHGVGECSSNEDKYKWRKIVCEQEFEEADPSRKRIVWKHGKNNTAYQLKQVRTNPSDLANTILKMAKKRGLVDGTMTVTAASRNFTQDAEDLPREYLDQQEPQKPHIPQTRPRNDATMVRPPAGTTIMRHETDEDFYPLPKRQEDGAGDVGSSDVHGSQPTLRVENQKNSDAPAPLTPSEFCRQQAEQAPDVVVDIPKFTFGKHKGKAVNDPSIPDDYLSWIEGSLREQIADPKFARYREEKQRLLDAIRSELIDRNAMPME